MGRSIPVLLMAFLVIISAFSVLAPLPAQASVGRGPRPAYTERGPIEIVGDEGFTSENGVVGGSGTPDDPYIIEGWEINATWSTGIKITNTRAYFIIRNCYIYSSTRETGIQLYNATNGRIESCVFLNCSFAIWLWEADNTVISQCNITSCIEGIDACESSGITIEGCWLKTMATGMWDVADISRCSDVVIKDTVLVEGYTSWYGIYVDNSMGILIENVSLTWSSNDGIRIEDCVGCVIANSSLGTTSTSGGTGIDLDNVTDIDIKGNTIERFFECGIWVKSGDDITIRYNTVGYCGSLIPHVPGIKCEGNDTMIYKNNFIYNGKIDDSQAYDSGIGNTWYDPSTHKGNYWGDHTGPDEDEDGIVDEPYPIAGPAGSQDLYPLTKPVQYPPTPPEGPSIEIIDIEPFPPGPDEDVVITARITDPDGVDRAEILYRTDTTWWHVGMSYVGDDTYEGTIPGQPAGTTVHWKVWAVDTKDNEAETEEHSYTVSGGPPPGDTEGPSITDITISPSKPGPGENVTVKAKITDPSGVAQAILSYSTDGGQTWTDVPMTPVGNDYYEARIPGQPKGTTVLYMIKAQDGVGNWATTSVRSYMVGEAAGPAPSPGEGAGIPITYVVGGAVVAAIAVGAAIALLKRRATAAYPPPFARLF